jgi:hypothetical protein
MRRLILTLTCLNLLSLLVGAQGIQTANLDNVNLHPLRAPHGVEGASAQDLFARYGISFGGNGASVEVVEPPSGPVGPPPEIWPVIRNTAPPAEDLPLVIDFDRPISKIRFQFLRGQTNDQASVSAFDRDGAPLGTLEFDIVGAPKVGIQAVDPAGISKLVVKYLGTQKNEELSGISFAFVTPPVFTTVLPQIGAGGLGNGRSLVTAITVLSLADTGGTGAIKFYGDTGQPLTLPLAGRFPAQTIPLNLTGDEMFSVTTGVWGQPLTGYAIITSNEPFQATASYRILQDSAIVSEVSLESAGPRYSVRGTFERFRAPGTVGGGLIIPVIDSAIGIVNLSNELATALITCVDDQQQTESVWIELQPGQHYARFLREVFPFLADLSTGVFTIRSGHPLAATLLRTADGLPISALPLGSLEY